MPNSTPESPDNIPPELEVALISLQKAKQDLIVIDKWLHDMDIADEIIGFHIQQAIEKPEKNSEIQNYLTIEADSDELYYAKGWAFIKGLDTHDLHIYFVLKSEQGQIFAFKCDSHIRKDVTQNYGHGLYLDKSGFNIVLPKKKLGIPSGSYKTGLYLTKDLVRALHYLGKSILVP